MIKATNEKPTANITVNAEKQESSSSKVRKKAKVSTLITSTQHSTASPGQSN